MSAIGPSSSGKSLIDVAAAVADGATVDWADLASGTADPHARAALERLELIARIAGAHTTPRFSGPADPAAPLEVPFEWGPLRVLEHVGRGSFGDVYRAIDGRLDREVALKMLREGGRSETIDSAVVEEARLMARVSHPNIVTIYGADRIDGRVGLWMEFIHGRTLEAELREGGNLPPDEVVRIGIALSRALAAVHAAGLIHRDVKAQNVMRDRQGRILLTDFGTGREVAEGETARGDLVGTPAYLAPEILTGEAASVASDVYSLGVLLFHLATASFPVRGGSIRLLREAHAASRRQTVREVRRDLPSRLAVAIDRATSPDPAWRHSTADQFAAELVSISGAPRRRRMTWIAAAAVIAMIGAAGLLWRASGNRADTLTATGGIRQLLTSESFVVSDISPDGRWALGTERPVESDGASLVIRDLQTGQATTLVAGSASSSAFTPIFSPDGREIVYRHSRRIFGGGFPSALGFIPSTPGSQSRLVEPPARRNLVPVGWQRDGTRVLTLVRVPAAVGVARQDALGWIRTDGTGPIETIKVFDQWQAPDGLRLSPDSRWVAYTAQPREDSVERRLYLLDTHTRQTTEIVRVAGLSEDPIWTPDGQALLFVSNRSGDRALWSVAIGTDGTAGELTLHRSTFSGRPLRLSAAGVLYYSQASGGEPLQFLIRRTPGGPRVVESFIGEKGQFSSSGQLIAFVRRVDPRQIDLIVRAVADGAETTHHGRGITLTPPRWLPGDREMLVYIGARGDGWLPGGAFYHYDIASRVFSRRFGRVQEDQTRSIMTAVSHDGQTLYATMARLSAPELPVSLMALNAVTGQGRIIATFPADEVEAVPDERLGAPGGLALSPDGRTLALLRWHDSGARQAIVTAIGVDGKDRRDIYGPFPADFLGNIANWTPDGRSVLVVVTETPGLARVMRVPVDGRPAEFDGVDSQMLGRTVPQSRLIPRNGLTLDLSPDGVHLLLAISTLGSSEIWSLDGIRSRR